MMTFPIQIVTPDGLIFDGQAERLFCRTIAGDVCILARHCDYMTALGMGEARLTLEVGVCRKAHPVFAPRCLVLGLGCRKENYQIPSEHFDDFYHDPLHFQPAEDGETIQQLCKRTREFYMELIHKEEYQDKTILIASHGCATRALLRNVYEDTSDFWHGSVPLNCAVNVVEVRDGKSRLLEEDKVYYGKEDCVNFYTADR